MSKAAAPKGPTYRALVGFNYPRPGGPQKVKRKKAGADVEAVEVEIRVEAGDEGLVLPAATVAALLPQGAIELWPPPPPPPPGSLSVVEEAGNLSLAQDGGQLSETKE